MEMASALQVFLEMPVNAHRGITAHFVKGVSEDFQSSMFGVDREWVFDFSTPCTARPFHEQLQKYSFYLMIPLVPFMALLILQSAILLRPHATLLRRAFSALSWVFNLQALGWNIYFAVSLFTFFPDEYGIPSVFVLSVWFLSGVTSTAFIVVLFYLPTLHERDITGVIKFGVTCVISAFDVTFFQLLSNDPLLVETVDSLRLIHLFLMALPFLIMQRLSTEVFSLCPPLWEGVLTCACWRWCFTTN